MKGLINTKKNIKGLVHPQYGTELDCFTTRTWPIVQKKPTPGLGHGHCFVVFTYEEPV